MKKSMPSLTVAVWNQHANFEQQKGALAIAFSRLLNASLLPPDLSPSVTDARHLLIEFVNCRAQSCSSLSQDFYLKREMGCALGFAGRVADRMGRGNP